MFKKLVFIIILFYGKYVFAQQEVFQHLALTNKNKGIRYIRYADFFDISKSIDSNYINLPVQIVATSKGIFLNIKGTGRLYKWNLEEKKFSRIDSTKLEGYNHGHLMYSYKDTIYSLGGYGFWTLYGITRYFSDVNLQWDMKKTNILVPSEFNINEAFYWIDQGTGTLYLIKKFYDLYQYSGLQQKDSAKVLSFKIAPGIWTELGKPEFIPSKSVTIIGINKNGLVFMENGILKIISFPDNAIKFIESKKSDSAFAYVTSSSTHLFYSSDDWLYFANVKTGQVDSILIETKDIKQVEKRIFRQSIPGNANNIWFLPALILMISIPFLWIKIIKKKQISPKDDKVQFSPTEFSILQHLSNRGIKNEHVSILELNKILGLTSKSSDIQKKYRSDVLSEINSKLANFSIGTEPIKRRRSSEDGRVFEYYCEPQVAIKIRDILNDYKISN